jgi:hypothetical protein
MHENIIKPISKVVIKIIRVEKKLDGSGKQFCSCFQMWKFRDFILSHVWVINWTASVV